MSEVIEEHTCFVHLGDQYRAAFEFPTRNNTNVRMALIGTNFKIVLSQVRDLHTFFAQLEEEMVRRMPAPAPVVEAASVQDDEVPF